VSDTLPDAGRGLKGKTSSRCAQIVIVGEILWNLLQNAEEFAADWPGCTPMHNNDGTTQPGSAAIAVRIQMFRKNSRFSATNEGRE
jgi:hypothetical protein